MMEGPQISVGECELGAGDRQPAGASTDGNHDGASVEIATVGNRDRVRVGKYCRTAIVDEVDPPARERVSQSSLIMHMISDPLGTCQGGGDIDLRSRAPQPEPLP